MNVLHVINSLEIGGAQRLLSDLLPIQIKQGLDVSVLVGEVHENAFSQKIAEAGVQILQINSKCIQSFQTIKKLRNIIRNFDVVHVHLFPSLYLIALASFGLKTKLVYTEHSTSNRRRDNKYLRPLERFIYSKYKKIISISQQTQDALQQWLNAKDDRFVVINNGVDIKHFSTASQALDKKSLIMVSRFVEAKDQATVIKAMAYLDSEVTLTLVGDGMNLDPCRTLAESIGVADRVEFLGSRNDIAELISSSYIGVQSSKWEGFGLTAVEIMAAGKPVIASDVDGLKQVIEGAGIIFKTGDEKALAAKINSLLEDPELYAKIGEACILRAADYDISIMAGKYKQVYEQACS